MDSRLLTIVEGTTGRFGVRRQSDLDPTGVCGARGNRGVGRGAPACRRFGFGDASVLKALRPRESAVAAARVEPDAQVFSKRCWYPPSLRFEVAAPLCRRTPKLSGIHKEPFLLSQHVSKNYAL